MTKANDTKGLTASQRLAYLEVRDFVCFRGVYEVKDLAVTQYDDGSAHVWLEVGRPNDEGTMASIICRSCYSFNIGKRGGIYVYTDKHSRKYLKYYEVDAIC